MLNIKDWISPPVISDNKQVESAVKHGSEVFQKLQKQTPVEHRNLKVKDLEPREQVIAYAVIEEIQDRIQAVIGHIKTWVQLEIEKPRRS